MHSSLAPLLQVVGTGEFEDEVYWLNLVGVRSSDGDVMLDLELYHQEASPERWQLHCHETRFVRFQGSFHRVGFEIFGEHVVLMPHLEPRSELYFSSSPNDADAVVGRLLETHRGFVGDWLPFFSYFNSSAAYPLSRLLAGGHGLLADGPKPLVEKYREVLDAASVRTSSPPARPPKFWSGTSWVEESGPLLALIMDENYVVARSITGKMA